MRLTTLLALTVLVAACGGSPSPPTSALPSRTPPAAQSATPGATAPAISPSPSSSATASASQGAVINVTLTDPLRIEPAQMTATAGQPVTFVVTNSGALDHEFYLGDADAQAEHEAEMEAMGGMMPHDEANGIALEPGETKHLTYTFPSPGEWLAGCHVTGHYPGGMKATITVSN